MTDAQIAEKMGISPSTFYEWKKGFPEISEALKAGKAPVNIELEDTAFDLALGRCRVEEVVTEIFYEGVDAEGNPIEKSRHVRKVVRQLPPNATTQIFLMKNRMPDKYREKREEQIQVAQADYSLLDGIKVDGDE